MRVLPLASFMLFMLYAAIAQGQGTDTFPDNPVQFAGELGNFLTASKNEEVVKTFKAFEPQVRGGAFSNAEFVQIRNTCNLMRQRRLSPSPHFKKYLDILPNVKTAQENPRLFEDWHQVLLYLLKPENGKTVNDFSNFLNFSSDLFAQQALRYASGAGITWRMETPTWTIAIEKEEPVLLVSSTTLTAQRLKDSIQILATSGRYFPLQFTWEGKSGKVTWERTGLGSDVYVELDTYSLDTRKGLYSVENALLSYPQFLGTRKIRGVFTDKVSMDDGEGAGLYPKFESLRERVEIKELGDGIRYFGGFRLDGKTFVGIGSKEQKAQLQIFNARNVLAFQGASERFMIRKGEILTAERVEALFFSQGDSIVHPSVNIQFNIPSKQLRLYRGERGSDRNPFYSSAHQVQIDADEILAFLESDSVLIGKPTVSIARKAPVRFESLNFFQQKEYEQFQGISSVNPLALIKVTAEREGLKVLDAEQIAKSLNSKYSAENISKLLYDLAAQGFINYDSDKQRIEVKDKVFHYVNASRDRIDYDAFRLISETDSTNAELNLRKKTIGIRGIKTVPISQRQKVTLRPDSSRVVLGPNRKLSFDGILQAGFSEIKGKQFQFDYPSFSIKADSITFFRLFAPEKRPSENPGLEPFALTSDIEKFSAVLLIDAENNKSGKEDIPIFPSLNSTSKSYVFYDGPFSKDTLYRRDSFYFELDPFNLNQLDNYIKDEIAFKGRLVSSQIFPEIRETLRVRPDYSLGFEHTTPKTGYPAFQKKGHFSGILDLSNRGLRGKGALKYLGATIESEDFLFRPAQATGSAKEFALAEVRGQNPVPQVSGQKVNIDWRPYRDSMYVSSADAAFKLFKENQHTLSGRIILTPGGLKGEGALEWPKAKINSPQFAFGAFSAKADTMQLEIKALDKNAIAIKTDSIRGEVDFDKKLATFRSNQEFLKTGLPFNQYETSMNEFDWDMAQENVTFKSDIYRLGTFTSTHPDQDTLTFQGKTAVYNMKNFLLQIGQVPFIKSADAFIYPDSGRIEIKAGGAMSQLENAVIVCDTITRNHRINRATVNILGRKEYRASGFYEYNIGDKKQEIAFTDIRGTRVGKGVMSQKATATLADGTIAQSDSFLIDVRTSFYGAISLGSGSANLKFDGFARLESDKLPERNWFNISSEGDKKDLVIAFRNPKTEEGFPLANGLFLSKEITTIYPRVMMPLYFRKDRPIFPVEGVFRYDKKQDLFIFGDSSKVLRNEPTGNKFIFHSRTGKVEAEGKFNLGSGLKYYSIQAAGKAQTEFRNLPDSLLMQTPPPPADFDLIAGFKFTVPEKLLRLMQNEIASASFGTGPIPYLADLDYYKKGFQEIFPNSRELQDALNTMSSGIVNLPKKDNAFTLLFSNMKLRWDRDYQSLVTLSPETGLVSILGEPVNLKINCFTEIKMPSNEDDRVYIYIKLPNEIYYYFGYRNGILELNSNDNRFMDEASKMKGSELNLKMPDGEPYEIQIVEANRATMFLRRAQAAGK